jgi:putative phage-type endonuclease
MAGDCEKLGANMLVHNCEQGSELWFAIKNGKFSASDAQPIATAGKGLETLVFEKASEILSTHIFEPDKYTNEDMERGHALEENARESYEINTGTPVTQVGFVEMNENVGCSPDGLVGDDGLIEIKCPKNEVFVRYMYDGKIDPKYYAQMQMQMLVTERKWVDYVVYNPNFVQQVIVKRVERDEVMIEKIKTGLDTGVKLLNEILRKVQNG